MLANGKEVRIERLKVGNILLGSKGAHNKIVKLDIIPKGNRTIYAFNGGRFFVTANHPFKTTTGWKALDPQAARSDHPGVKIEQLKIGDELITVKGSLRLNKIESKTIRSVVYSAVTNGTHEYYSDGFLVHNKAVTCFVPGTAILLDNGKKLAIEYLKVGDVLLGSGDTHNKIVKIEILPKEDRKIYAFNGGRFFVTANHPFKTATGWKALDPKAARRGHPGVKIGKLKIGDELITIKGPIRLNKIKSKTINTSVYSVETDGAHEYYSDDFLVHNKIYQ